MTLLSLSKKYIVASVVSGLSVFSTEVMAETTDTSHQQNPYVAYNQPVIALVGVKLIDGTGAKMKPNQTIIMTNSVITYVGDASNADIAEGTKVINGAGKSVIPGLVMMHEHMFYPTGNAHYTEMLYSFPKLYLAGGATTVRTAGTTAPYGDLNVRDAIQQGTTFGPDIDVTAPYLNGPGLPILKLKSLRDAENAK
ncbi:amidohydrolase family protein [Shewanella sp. MF05960]|uniref:amidohydrolase family protein n=1 Tax=Shewanella sp. MF05960 TaxID=3434874 RepID=UPI003D795219